MLNAQKFLLFIGWAASILVTFNLASGRGGAAKIDPAQCVCPEVRVTCSDRECVCAETKPCVCPECPSSGKRSTEATIVETRKVVPSTCSIPASLEELDPAFDSVVFHNGRTESQDSLFYKLATREKTSKVAMHAYQIPYAQWLTPRRLEPLNFLEIGLFGGASMRVWDEFFPNAKIFGTDINADIDSMKRKSQRLQLFKGDQRDCDSLKKVVEAAGGSFDIIIDDGGHGMDMQQISFMCLFPYMTEGGLYFIEDLQTSYSPDYNKIAGWKVTTDVMKGWVDVIQRSWRDHPWEIEETYAKGVDHLIQSMHVYNNAVLLVKGKIHQRWNDATFRWDREQFPPEEQPTVDNIHNYWNKQKKA